MRPAKRGCVCSIVFISLSLVLISTVAASDSKLRNPREHEAFGEAVLVHPGHVPCPEQRATREVVLEREDPGALLEALGCDAVDVRL